jgi:outer membrane receptor protein involved in Fe transport
MVLNLVKAYPSIVLVLTLLIFPWTVFAEYETPDPEIKGGEVVVTAERSPEDLSESTRSVSVVTGEEIFERISRTVPEALRYEEGVMVQRTNLGGGAPFIRGFAGNQVLYLIDGIRLNNSTFRGGPNQYLNTIDPFFIQQIEVVRGPGSVLYGTDALGGVINVITKGRDDFSKPWGMDGRLMSRASTGEKEQTAHLDFTSNFGSVLGTAFSGNFRAFGDIDPGSTQPIQSPYGYEEQDFAGNLDVKFGDKVNCRFAAQYVNLDEVPNYDPGNPKNLFEPQRRNLFYTKVSLNDLNPFLDRVEFFGSFQKQTEGRQKIGADDPDVETRDLDIVDTYGAGLQLENPVGNWVRFIYGGEFYYDSIFSDREVRSVSGGTAADASPQLPDDSTFLNAAGYFEARVTPTDWLKLVPGIRYSTFMPDIELDDPELGKVTIDDEITDLTWAFHTLFKVADYHGIAAGVSRGFRAPSVDDLSKLGSEDGRYDVPNPDLESEKMIQYELGYRFNHRRAYVSLFGYYSQIEDLIARRPASYLGESEIGNDAVHRNENVGESYIYGAEFATKLVVLEDFFNMGGTAAYTFGQNETDDEPLRRIPPVFGTAWARMIFGPVWIETAMEAAGEQDRLSQGDKDDSRIGPEGTSGFDVWHLRLGAHPAKWVETIFTVENLTDEKYKYHGSGPLEPGRNYKAQVSFLF